MIVKVNISGKGEVCGAGEYNSGDSVKLTATPLDIYSFKHFVLDSGETFPNDYTFVVGDNDVTIQAVFYVTMEQHLSLKVGFDLNDGVVSNILVDRGLNHDDDILLIDKDLKDLCYADVLMYGATMPSSIGGAKESDFGWSKQESTKTMSITDKREMRRIAMNIYKRLDPTKYASNLKITSLTGKRYYGRYY